MSDVEVAEAAAAAVRDAADQRDRDDDARRAAERKFCTVSPSIWLRYVSVVSPP